MKIKQKIINYFFKKIAQKKVHSKIEDIKIKRILLIRDGGIGDAICSYPLIRELKKNYPNSKIDIFASLNNSFMYKYTPWINNIYLKYKKRQWYKTWFEVFKMRRNRYDLVIDDTVIRLHKTIYTILIKPKFVVASADKKDRYGFNRNSLSFYDRVYETNENIIHIVDRRLKALNCLNITNYNNKMTFFLPSKLDNKIELFFNDLKSFKLIALNADSSQKTRALNKNQIIELSRLLNNDKIKIIPLCIPSKIAYLKEIIKDNNLTNVIFPYETKTIYEAAQILNNVDLLISPDTSFIHIASGLNIPTIGLFWNNPIKYIEWDSRSDISVALTPEGTESNLENINLNEIQENAFKILNIKK